MTGHRAILEWRDHATGFFGTLRDRHLGWWFAGALGSAAPAGCLWIVTDIAAAWEDAPIARARMMSDTWLVCLGIILIGVCLGAALDRALRSGRSIVPGVHRLATFIKGMYQPERVA